MFSNYTRKPLMALVIVCTLFGLAYNAVIVLGYGPDEPRHMAYVKLLLDHHEIPRLDASGQGDGGATAYHPPLYYLLLCPFYAAARALMGTAGWNATRLVSLALCVFSLPLIYEIALKASQQNRRIALFAAAFVGLCPIFGMTAGTINNDSGMMFLTSLFLWLLVCRYPEKETLKSSLVLGVAMGLGGLCKATSLLCDFAALFAVIIALSGWRGLFSERNLARIATIALVAAVFAGPWHLRSFLLYGTWTPLPPAMHDQWLPNPEKYGVLAVAMHDHFLPIAFHDSWSIFYSMWTQKDWLPFIFRTPVYLLLALFCAAGALGMIVKRKSANANEKAEDRTETQQEAPPVTSEQFAKMTVWACCASFLCNGAAILATSLFWHWGWSEGGRYLLPSLGLLGIIVGLGWRNLVGDHRFRIVAAVFAGCLAALNLISLYWLKCYLNPKYATKVLVSETLSKPDMRISQLGYTIFIIHKIDCVSNFSIDI